MKQAFTWIGMCVCIIGLSVQAPVAAAARQSVSTGVRHATAAQQSVSTGVSHATAARQSASTGVSHATAAQQSASSGVSHATAAQRSVTARVSHVTAVRLQWQTDGQADGYIIRRGSAKNGVYAEIASVSAKTFQYTDTHLPRGTTGYYEVTAWTADTSHVLWSARVSCRLSGKPKRPVLSVKKQKGILKFGIKGMDGVDGVYLYGKKAGGKYTLYQISRDAYPWYPRGKQKSFRLKAAGARGVYFFRIRSYGIVRGRKVYSAFSKPVKVVMQ